eukprot:3581842-Alexandrium_andersonii.AAC.1
MLGTRTSQCMQYSRARSTVLLSPTVATTDHASGCGKRRSGRKTYARAAGPLARADSAPPH